eukprot:TRINITY_DN9724_c0_g1_i2.p1 TRINITY_DN9724_c0_g1~~TRINITY_DN9724_c0_g1_i2.p1  ORF type:complete len:662 (+),score=134.36 TRINITY_DN9724_c0_g1_i2:88-2073(+)
MATYSNTAEYRIIETPQVASIPSYTSSTTPSTYTIVSNPVTYIPTGYSYPQGVSISSSAPQTIYTTTATTAATSIPTSQSRSVQLQYQYPTAISAKIPSAQPPVVVQTRYVATAPQQSVPVAAQTRSFQIPTAALQSNTSPYAIRPPVVHSGGSNYSAQQTRSLPGGGRVHQETNIYSEQQQYQQQQQHQYQQQQQHQYQQQQQIRLPSQGLYEQQTQNEASPKDGDMDVLRQKVADLEKILLRQEQEMSRSQSEWQRKIDDLERKVGSSGPSAGYESRTRGEVQSRLLELERRFSRKSNPSSADVTQTTRSFQLPKTDVITNYEFGHSSRDFQLQHEPQTREIVAETASTEATRTEIQYAYSSERLDRNPVGSAIAASYSTNVASVKAEPRPIRVVRGDQLILTVVSARSLQIPAHPSAELFATITFGRQEAKTAVAKSSSMPIWKESFSFTINDVFDKIKLSIYDNSQHPVTTIVGHVIIPTSSLQEVAWYELEDKGRYAGEIKLQARAIATPTQATHVEERPSQPPSQPPSKPPSQPPSRPAPTKPQGETPRANPSPVVLGEKAHIKQILPSVAPASPRPRVCNVKINVVQAKDLLAKDITGSSDPFVVLELAGQQFKTEVVKRNLNPKWYEGLVRPIILQPFSHIHPNIKISDDPHM